MTNQTDPTREERLILSRCQKCGNVATAKQYLHHDNLCSGFARYERLEVIPAQGRIMPKSKAM